MDLIQPLELLGGISPQVFMKQHWQKKPLLIRQAIPNFRPLLDRTELFELAGHDDVQSRLIVRKRDKGVVGWSLRQGPFKRRAIPALGRPEWTLLVQGVDLHHDAVHALMNRFRFVPDGRLDDVMISYASEGGGVGPHFDSYDVFLLQAHGRRRWQIGRQKNLALQEGVPLKILAHFEPEKEIVLEPGDMLYLPPRYAHDGVSLDPDCMTYSIGFRAPKNTELIQELLSRLADSAPDCVREVLYHDPLQVAVKHPAMISQEMVNFALQSVSKAVSDQGLLAQLLGEHLTEPKGSVWFEPHEGARAETAYVLDRRTKMMYDHLYIYMNGECFQASGRDAKLIRLLADDRKLAMTAFNKLSAQAQELVNSWLDAGWIHGV